MAESYSRPIEKPKTQLEGLRNFAQRIINQIEEGDHREALLLAVDLRDALSSDENPLGAKPPTDAEYGLIYGPRPEWNANDNVKVRCKSEDATVRMALQVKAPGVHVWLVRLFEQGILHG